MASSREPEENGLSQEKNVLHVVVFTDGSKLILDQDNLLLLHDHFDNNERACFLVGRYIGEGVVYKHTVFLAHIVRISPYFESVSDIEPVGRATMKAKDPRGPIIINWDAGI